MNNETGNTKSISTCTTCGAPYEGFEDRELAELKRVWAPYHACTSWTYVMGDRAEEALLRIRKELKVAAGWWNDSEEQQWQEAMALVPSRRNT